MKPILKYIRDYFKQIPAVILLVNTLFIGIFIFWNYYTGLDAWINRHTFCQEWVLRALVFGLAFVFPWALTAAVNKRLYFKNPGFVFLLIAAPLIFGFKLAMAMPFALHADPAWNNYWNHILYWPLLGIIITAALLIIWRLMDRNQPFYGMKLRQISWKPYWLMLLIMVPLVAAASTQPDFLAMYPKFQAVASARDATGFKPWHQWLFELAYGSDFFGIELFFRGFLVLAFFKWAGKDAILPMATFYCTIHFGKPLGECISSYFGGLILGIVVAETRSIFGGLMVHLGIAWMMEAGGTIGHHFFP